MSHINTVLSLTLMVFLFVTKDNTFVLCNCSMTAMLFPWIVFIVIVSRSKASWQLIEEFPTMPVVCLKYQISICYSPIENNTPANSSKEKQMDVIVSDPSTHFAGTESLNPNRSRWWTSSVYTEVFCFSKILKALKTIHF